MDKEYWEHYYSNQNPSQQPSPFAQFISERYLLDYGELFDIGCGNGRDSFFFSSQSIQCTGVDQCAVVKEKNEKKKLELGLDVSFLKEDFSSCDYDSLSDNAFSVYSRFTLHAINYEEEKLLFQHLNSCKNLKYLLIEVRSIHDELYGQGEELGLHEFLTSHYRRFIDPATLKTTLQKNYKIEYFEEALGFAKTETEDPCLIRLIAKKN